MHSVIKWSRVVIALTHVKLAYGRGRSWLDLSSGLVGGLAATGQFAAIPAWLAGLILFYILLGLADDRWLHFWQEESRLGAQKNPEFAELVDNVRYIKSRVAELDARQRARQQIRKV